MEASEHIGLRTEINVFRGDSGRLIAHAPLAGRAVVISEQAKSVIEDLKAGIPLKKDAPGTASIVEDLRRLGLIGTESLATPKTMEIDDFRPVEATLIFTESCNLGCTYCYSSAKSKKAEPLSPELMRAAVDLVCRNAAELEKAHASFRYIGGGEPTVEWDLLKEATQYIQATASRYGVTHFIRLITNGTLLTADRISWIAKNISFVTLSFDILPELQRARSFASGRETHTKLIEVIRQLSSCGVKFHLRSTISATGAHRLEEMVQYVHDQCHVESIRFEPMSEIGRSIDSSIGKPSDVAFVESFKSAYKLGKSLGIHVTCKMFTNLTRRNSRFCDAEFTVTPQGTVSGCHRYSREDHEGFDLFRIGQYDGDRFKIDLKRLNALRNVDVHHFKDCNTCIAKWNCASGCLSARVGPAGISEKGPLCHLTRELLKFSIDEKIGDQSHDD